MKRLISLLIAVSVILGIFTSWSASAAKQYDVGMYNGRLTSLKNLGVINDELDSISLSDEVTGGDFETALANIFGSELANPAYGLNENTRLRYIDIESALKILVDIMGYNPAGTYRMWYTEAKKLGLTDYLSATSGNLTSYDLVMLVFNALKATPNDITSYREKSTFVYERSDQTLSQIYLGATYFEGVLAGDNYGELSYASDCGKDFVQIRLINGGMLKLRNEDIDTYGFLGYRTEGFYREDDTKELVAIYPYENEILVLNHDDSPYINAGSINYTDGDKVRREKLTPYMELIHNGRHIGTSELSALLNDKAGQVFYDLTLINNGIGTKYNVVAVRTYNPIVADTVASDELYVMSHDGDVFDYNDKYEKGLVRIKNCDDSSITIKDISSGEVLNVFENIDPEKSVVIVKTADTKEGYLSSMSDEGVMCYELEIIGDEKSDMMEVSGIEPYIKNASVGSYYEFIFDISGRLLALKPKNVAYKTGVFVKLGAEDEAFDNNIKLLVFGELGEETKPQLKLTPLAKGAKVFGKKVEDSDIASVNKKLFHTIVSYSVNSNGEIVKIFTSDTEEDSTGLETLNRHSMLESLDSKVDTQSLSFGINLDHSFYDTTVLDGENGNTKIREIKLRPLTGDAYCDIISVPDISIKEAGLNHQHEYGILDIINKEYFPVGGVKRNKAEAYFEKGRVVPKYVVYSKNWLEAPQHYEDITYLLRPMLINEVRTAVNPKTDEISTKVSGMYFGKYVDFYTADTKLLNWRSTSSADKYVDISEGDVLLVMFDAQGDLTFGARIYDYDPVAKTGDIDEKNVNSTNKLYKNTTGFVDISQSNFIYEGYMYHVLRGSGLFYTINDRTLSTEQAYASRIGFGSPTKNTYVFDTSKRIADGRATAGTVSGATVRYVQDAENASKVVIHHRSGLCQSMIIYK